MTSPSHILHGKGKSEKLEHVGMLISKNYDSGHPTQSFRMVFLKCFLASGYIFCYYLFCLDVKFSLHCIYDKG